MSSLPLYLITGLSGAGKSHALQAFEDMGFYCVDNLPSEMLESFLDHCFSEKDHKDGIAIVLDVREGEFVSDFHDIVSTLRNEDVDLEILFLEATTDVLLNRYKESRRPHPLGDGRSLKEAIETETNRLDSIREESDMVIDTSEMNIHQFKGLLNDIYHPEAVQQFTLSLTSFGFKHGVPDHLDTLFDARILPNPYYEPELKGHSGKHEEVADFLSKSDLTQRYLSNIKQTIDMMLESYQQEGKRFLSIGFGCTGGRHRSVYLVEQIAEYGRERDDCRPVILHRDLAAEGSEAGGSDY